MKGNQYKMKRGSEKRMISQHSVVREVGENNLPIP